MLNVMNESAPDVRRSCDPSFVHARAYIGDLSDGRDPRNDCLYLCCLLLWQDLQ